MPRRPDLWKWLLCLLCGKVPVASLKKQTIYRLELQAASLRARIDNLFQDELKLNLTGRTF